MFTNRNSHSDFIQTAIERNGRRSSSVNIAVPFFTNLEVVNWLTEKGCEVNLVVRLGFPTSADALKVVLKNDRVKVRYFTDPSFHSKLYIFGDHTALVGSANLTKAALLTNQEIILTISSEDPRFEDLAALFGEYWEDSKVLTSEALNKYAYLCKKHDNASNCAYDLESDILKNLGRVVSKNITRDTKKERKQDVFIEDYRKTYQETVSTLNEVRKVYESVGERKVSSDIIPLRLEIDSFLSFVREEHAQGDSWREAPVLELEQRRNKILPLVKEWLVTEWSWFEKNIVQETYPRLKQVFGSADSVRAASDEELFRALRVVHSFKDSFRFYQGGTAGLRESFFSHNNRKKINDSLIYLVHGGDEVEKRMCNLIFNSAYKLRHFGRANVQELVGWATREKLPIVNGRTTKILSYFGFKVRQCQ